jgi:hypothetical protein
VLERHDFEEDLAEAERAPADGDRFKKANLGYIDDVVESLEWVSYIEDEDVESYDEAFEPLSSYSTPYINPWRHVGRNDPCPCGSGKKAKKCCLANGGPPA